MKIKFTRCAECEHRLDVGDEYVDFDGYIFCDDDCAVDYCRLSFSYNEISESDCTEEDEDFRDDEDE
jgi:hypothetical protein